MDNKAKQAALTFDDGPNGRYTLDILKILKQFDVKAAFFFLGMNVERQPGIALVAKESGHIIGNHTYSHRRLNLLSASEIQSEIDKAEDIFYKELCHKPCYFRPPYGSYNKQAEDIIKKKGYKLVLWDMDCYAMDWLKRPAWTIADIATAKAKQGSIILLHDGRNIREDYPRENTIKALPIIIPRLIDMGFDITTLDALCSN